MDFINGPLENSVKATNKQNAKKLTRLLHRMKTLSNSHTIKWPLAFIPPKHLRLSKYTYNV